jgi:hypothetical protein
MYKSVTGLPKCIDANNKKSIWQPGDPVDGIDFNVFRQFKSEPNFDGSCP